jgi:hypothetical protein
MGVTRVAGNSSDLKPDLRHEVDKIAHSSIFRGSELLRELLEFFREKALADPSKPVKEALIAERVFKRIDFAPQTDSAVRVHVGRLRSKLAEYYLNEGVSDPIIVEIPRGSYLLKWHFRDQTGSSKQSPLSTAIQQDAPPAPNVRSAKAWLLVSLALALTLVAVSFGWLRSVRSRALPPALATFWKDFLPEGGPDPVIEFTVPEFVGSELTGMSLKRGAEDMRGPLIDTWTGVGEVASVFCLTRIMDSFGKSTKVKGARLLTWDEAKERNIIFLGSPDTNGPLRSFPHLRYFEFKPRADEPRVTHGGIVNIQPRPGEEKYYFILHGANPANWHDFAIVALVPGTSGVRRVLILAGITTISTQAAAEFVCREDSMALLLNKMGVKRGGHVPFFEALLNVTVLGGVPVEERVQVLRIGTS